MRLRNVKKMAGLFSVGVMVIVGCQKPQNPFNQEDKTTFNFIDEKKPGDSVWNINIDDTLKLSVVEKQLKYIDSITIVLDSDTTIVHVKDPNNFAWEDTVTVKHLFSIPGEKVIIGSIYQDGKVIVKDSIKIFVQEILLTISSNGGGTVSPSGTSLENYGASKAITATPYTNYHFVEWTRSGTEATIGDSLQASTTVVLTGSATITAVFAINSFTLTDSSGGNGTVSPSGTSSVNYGAATPIIATPNTGYHFVKWTRSGPEASIMDSTQASTTVVLTDNATITAVFSINSYSLNIPSGMGVSGFVSPFGLLWVNYGASTAIKATPYTGYHFVKWTRSSLSATISDSTQPSITVVLTGNATVTAVFSSDSYTLTVSSVGNGTVSPSGSDTVKYTDTTAITARTDTGYHFVNWTRSSLSATISDSTQPSTKVFLTGSATVTAVFEINTYCLTVTNNGSAGGTISPYGSRTVNYGASTAITATANTGYHFVEWIRDDTTATIGDSTLASTTVVLTGSATVTAMFTYNYYDLTVTNIGSGTTSPSGTTSVRHGTLTLIIATANTGYHFTGWSTSGPEATISSPGSSMTTLILTGPATITATFAINTYTLTVSSSGNGTVSPSGSDTVNYGAVTSIIATPDTGYSFIKWTRSGSAATISDSTQASTGVFLTGNATVTAIFQ